MTNQTVKHLALVVVVVALTSAFALAQPAGSQTPAEQSLTGTVTCEARVTHLYSCQRNQTQQTCTLACVQQGSKFVLLVNDRPYLLEGDSHALEAFAGGKATVTGVTLNGRIEVETATNAKHTKPGQSNPLPSNMGTSTK
jgi:hypothetical protein